jgi:hypothetical protein
VEAKIVLKSDPLGRTDLTCTAARLGNSKNMTSAGEALEAGPALVPSPAAPATLVHDPTAPAAPAAPIPDPTAAAASAPASAAASAYGPGGALSTPARKRRQAARRRKKEVRGATAAPASIE